MKHLEDTDHKASALDGGVTFTSLTATRTVALPPLATMRAGSPIFPIADESGNASATTMIVVHAAGTDLINGSPTATLSIATPYQTILLVAGLTNWIV